MKVKDLIKDKDYDYISWHETLPERLGGGHTFVGSCHSKNGELIPNDQDDYNENEEVLGYEEFTNENENIACGLTVITKGYWPNLDK